MTGSDLETQIGQWREHIRRHGAVSAADVEELEDHLREQLTDLAAAGLSEDEAFIVAIKRMGGIDELTREFAREHSDRLWKQLVMTTARPRDGGARSTGELVRVLGLAIGAAIAVKAGHFWLDPVTFAVNLSLLTFPFLTAYFGWKRRLSIGPIGLLAGSYALAALVLNVYPYPDGSDTAILAAIHVPIAAWLVVGAAYVGGDWRSGSRRMDFIRFTGEFVIYYVLLGLGGAALIGLTVGSFAAVGIDASWFIFHWVLPIAMPGAALVAAWLVEAKQDVIENLAPVLTRVFTPLTIVMLLAVLVLYASTRTFVEADRTLLILMDLILVLVLGLLLYAISARDRHAPASIFDWLQLILIVCGLALDILMLAEMLTRIAEFGSSPNKIAALGMNVVLFVNLARSAVLSFQFVRQGRGVGRLERWQTRYLPVYGAWAAAVVVILPPLVGYA